MELPHIGDNCFLKECNRLDFLPVKCDACNQVFCIEHYRYDAHKCNEASKKDVQVPICPLCMLPVGSKPDQLPDLAVSEHIDKFCKRNDLLKRRGNHSATGDTSLHRCSFGKCRQKDVIYLECQDCKEKYCVKHRHPSDHLCKGSQANSFSSTVANNWNSFRNSCSSGAPNSFDTIKNKVRQLSKSGQAVVSRITAHGSTSNGQSYETQATRSSDTQQALRNLQGDMDEQQALALALRQSMSNTRGESQRSNSSGQADLSEDAALARAILESEIDSLDSRRGNAEMGANGHHQKSNCVLS